MPLRIDSGRTDKSAAFDSLFHKHHQVVYRYCLRRLGPDEADDAAAEVFAIAWRRLKDIPEGEAAAAWLFGAAHKVTGNRFRSRRRQASLHLRVTALWTRDGLSDHSENQPGILDVRAALSSLGRNDQEILKLSSWEGLSSAEIAAVLGIKPNAVDQRLHRARARLKTRLEQVSPATDKPQEAHT